MQRCAFTPYEGNEPYIFISYAHKDSKRVYPVLEELNRRGYRVWYDDGIAPGSEWPENIAQHLSGCALTMAFISPASIASDNCRREVTFALSKRKPFLGILLEPTEMSPGMEMQLSAQQCIMKFSYAAEEDFLRKVCSCPDMAPCLKPRPVQPEVKEETKTVPAPAPAPAPAPKPAAQLDKKKIGLIAGVAAAAVTLILLAVILMGGNDQKEPAGPVDSTPGQSDPAPGQSDPPPAQDNKTLSYENVEITQDMAAQIREKSELESLSFVGCTFETDLSFLKSLTGLKSLTLRNCGLTDADIAGLTLSKLEELDISENPQVTDITPLASFEKLRVLKCAACGITSIDTEFMCLRLEVLDLSDNGLKDTVNAFANCTVLTHVDLAYNDLYDVEFLEKNTATLQMIDLSGNTSVYEWDLEFLAECPNIREVYIDHLNLGTLSFLEGADTLEKLSAINCRISDLEPLRGMNKLNYVCLGWNNVEDISPLSGLKADGLVLDLAMNSYLYDVSSLPVGQYKVLNLMGDVDVSTLPQVSGECLVLAYSDGIIGNAVLEADPFEEYFLLECPTDKIVAMEDLFGEEDLLRFTTLEEYAVILEAMGMDSRFLSWMGE